MTEDSPKVKYYEIQVLTMDIVKTVAISEEQQDFLKSECINFSAFVRKCINKEMRKDG